MSDTGDAGWVRGEHGAPDSRAGRPRPGEWRGVDDRIDNETRREALRTLQATSSEEPLDLLVIGGGVVGVGSALDGALRGLRVGLVEAGDLAIGTSSRSSRLAHGGLRYLEQGEFGLVHEALRERGLLLDRLAPHLVRPVPMLFPVMGRAWERTYMGAGVTLYDVLSRVGAYGGTMPRPRILSGEQLRGIAPTFNTETWRGAVQFHDAQINDARHTMTVARSATGAGAVIALGCRVIDLIHRDETVVGAVVEPDDGDPFHVYARVTLSATGVWTDDLLRMANPGSRASHNVRQSKGVHLVVRGDRFRSTQALIARTPYSVLFVLPWDNVWLVGTTDTDYDGDLADPRATEQDVDYLIEQANRWLAEPLTRDDVVGVYCGLRPLVAAEVAEGEEAATTALSREHVVLEPRRGCLVVTGGKYTTYRAMAADAVDNAVTVLATEVFDGREMLPSSTDEYPLAGAHGYHEAWAARRRLARDHGLPESVLIHLLRRHGDRVYDVLDLVAADPRLGERIHPDAPQLRAEAVVAVTHEGARTLRDVMERRLRISLALPGGGVEIADAVAELIAGPLGWDEDQRRDQVAGYLADPPGATAPGPNPDGRSA